MNEVSEPGDQAALVNAQRVFGLVLEDALALRPGLSDLQFLGDQRMWTVAQKVNLPSEQVVSTEVLRSWAGAFGGSRGGLSALDGSAGTLECAVTVNDRRCRLTFRRQNNGLALAVRVLPESIPAATGPFYASNPIPQHVIDVVLAARPGIGLVCGPVESGKSTLLASLCELFNETRPGHIMTLEDPIEYVFQEKRSRISQREVPLHVASFAQGLVTAKRSTPSVLVVGELRDAATMRTALDCAAQGNLVLATSHASNAVSALAEFLFSFGEAEIALVRQRLSEVLRFVMMQQLITTEAGEVIPVRELLLGSPTVRANIAENNFDEITRELQSRSSGVASFSLERELWRLVNLGRFSRSVALRVASNIGELQAAWHVTDDEVAALLAEVPRD